MSAEHAANLGFFEARSIAQRKRDEEYAAACAAMRVAIRTSPFTTTEVTAQAASLLLNDSAKKPLLDKSPREWAFATLKIINRLKIENPRNREFLTEVLKNVTNYIQAPNNPLNVENYQKIQGQVATKYGRYSALSVALLGLPASILIGGIIATTIACMACPPAMPGIVVGAVIFLMLATGASLLPSKESIKISRIWDDLKADLGLQRPALGI